MKSRGFANVIGFDDGPFAPEQTDPVPVVGAVFAASRLDGLVTGHVTRDGDDATDTLARLVIESRFHEHAQLILTQGIAMGGFNVIDIHELAGRTDRPVLAVARHRPDLDAIRDALIGSVREGEAKWGRIEAAGMPMPVEGLHVQCAGLRLDEAAGVIRRFRLHAHVPEPLRVAHLVARAMVSGESRGRV